MSGRSMNNAQFCKEDMRRAYRDKVGGTRRRRIKIRDIIDILDIIVPVIPDFFGANSAGTDNYNSYSSNIGGSYGREDDMPARFGNNIGGRCGFGMSSGDYGNESGYCGGHGNANKHPHFGMRMPRADDYYDREISEEEFERLLDFAEQSNVKRY